ncbi:MAG TPA: DUF4832 domain-containing protein [Verrucomicrobiae bacterium]
MNSKCLCCSEEFLKGIAASGLHLQMRWANVGVGKLYRPYTLQFTLTDSSGKVCLKSDGKTAPGQWLPGEHPIAESLQLPVTIESGEYTLTVGVMDPTGQRQPFRLAIDAPESDGRYSVSRVTVK